MRFYENKKENIVYTGLSYASKKRGNNLDLDLLEKDASRVVFLDFVPSDEDLIGIWERNIPHLIIDHHATAIEQLNRLREESGVFLNCYLSYDNSLSGVGLVNDWCREVYGRTNPYWELFKNIQDRDLWQFRFGDTESISEALYTYDFDFKTWDELLDLSNNNILNVKLKLFYEGEAICRFKKRTIDLGRRSAYTLQVGPYIAKALNSNVFMSEFGNKLTSEDGVDFAIIYSDDKDGNKRCSLRSNAGFDCSKIAKFFGGGGHQQACGCLVSSIEEFKKYYE